MIVLLLPWLLILLLVVSVGFACFRWWKTAFGLLVLALALNWYFQIVPLNLLNANSDSNANSKALKLSNSETLKLLSWNIHGGDKDTLRYEAIAERVKEVDADVVYLAELFMETQGVMDSLLRERYPYRSKLDHLAHSIYSREPVDTAYEVNIEGGNEMNIACRIKIKGKWGMVYGCHLSSNNYTDEEDHATNIERVGGARSLMDYMKGISKASAHRKLEAERIVEDASDKEGFVLVVGDLNDVCGSPTLRTFEDAGFEDAWWNGGFGYGATIHRPLPYRIDHVLYRSEGSESSEGERRVKEGKRTELKLVGIRKIDADGLSDHDALVAEFGF